MRKYLFTALPFVVCTLLSYTAAYPQAGVGSKELFYDILCKMEDKIIDNYYPDLASDLLQPVRYSEYVYVDSSKQLLSAVYVEGIKSPSWLLGASKKHYNKPWEFYLEDSYCWRAELYQKRKGKQYCGDNDLCYTFLRSIAMLGSHVQKSACPNNSDSAQVMPAEQIDSTPQKFAVTDILYEGRACYKLIRLQLDVYTTPVDIFVCDSLEYIIGKDDYALLYCYHGRFWRSPARNQLAEDHVEVYDKVGGTYQQTLYTHRKRWLTSYVDSSGASFGALSDTYCYSIKQAMHVSPPANLVKIHTFAPYEAFCTPVSEPNAEMLKAWNEFVVGRVE
jgi:hypothetical protein